MIRRRLQIIFLALPGLPRSRPVNPSRRAGRGERTLEKFYDTSPYEMTSSDIIIGVLLFWLAEQVVYWIRFAWRQPRKLTLDEELR